MKTTIRYYKRNVYGNDHIYAIDHTTAISQLTRKKTLDNQAMDALRALGFELIEVLSPDAPGKG